MRLLSVTIGGGSSPFDEFYDRAVYLARKGEFSRALLEIQKAIPDASPWKKVDCLALQAEWLQRLDNESSLREAISVYRKLDQEFLSFPHDVKHKKFLYRIALIHEILNDREQALDVYRELIKRTEDCGYLNEDFELELALYREAVMRVSQETVV